MYASLHNYVQLCTYVYVFLTGSSEATGASDSVTRVEFYARECSRARKLVGVCNEFQVSIYSILQ